MTKHYLIIKAGNDGALTDKVNELAEQGYRPVGGVSILIHQGPLDRAPRPIFAQAVFRDPRRNGRMRTELLEGDLSPESTQVPECPSAGDGSRT